MEAYSDLNLKIQEIAQRIRALREIVAISAADMAKKTDVTEEEYLLCEAGKSDLNFAFIYRCALAFGVDVTDLISGTTPTLRSYTVTRSGKGQKIEQAHGMTYFNLAPSFKNRIAQPLYVECPYDAQAEAAPIEVTTHRGQECDIVLKGALKVQVGEHIETLYAGDSIYYNSDTPHGMVATEGQDCAFYAIVLSPESGEDPAQIIGATKKAVTPVAQKKASHRRIYHNFIHPKEREDGSLISLSFENDDKFNFAFDVVDALADRSPEKLAMLHLDRDKTERRFTFADMKRLSAQAANYFLSLGIRRGDKVMLVLKRHYQFWIAILALHKIGAIVIPATNQLQVHDFTYRYEAADVRAILCTADGDTANAAEQAMKETGRDMISIIVHGENEGWHSFDTEFARFSEQYPRTADAPCGSDPMLMFFTSGTTGYPKIALHDYKLPLGHFITANYWHCVEPDGLHLTISDTGWAKSLWGKLYGQWLCEGATFVYDLDRFDAAEILPLFAKYQITTFCAPPTMLRMLIRGDLSKYDLSSIHHMTTAGEALNPEVFKKFKEATGLEIMEGFGQSETTLAIGNLHGQGHKLGSMGKPVPLYDITLLDPDGNPVGVGESGEICIRTAQGKPNGLFCQYYNDTEKTQEVWHDGYYHTGDVAWCDEDGFYWYVGRADDVIKSSGYRIGPFEIESVIMELPYVLECGVCAAPDEIRGQVVKACIVLTKGTEPSEALKKEIQAYVKEKPAPYKYPRIVEFRTELPKTTCGKIILNRL